jgi:ABC-2 type transport system ATP-binding protein
LAQCVSFRGTRPTAMTADSGPVIERLSKRHRNVSFRAATGRMTALVGPNGAGRSLGRAAAGKSLGRGAAGGSLGRGAAGKPVGRGAAATAVLAGRRYRELDPPMRAVGAVIDGSGAAQAFGG